MPQQATDSTPFEMQSKPIGMRFILGMILLAIMTLGVHVGLTALITAGRNFIHPSIFPRLRGPMAFSATTSVSPGNSAVWNGELWASVATAPNMGRVVAIGNVRAPSSRLVAIDLQTGKVRETGLTLTPAPVGMLVVNGKLWTVSETVVHQIQGGQLTPRHPVRSLNDPSNPFLYEGKLAVIDKNKSDVYSLLTWNEGEWTEVGKVDVPPLANPSPWVTAHLKVVADDDSVYLFFNNGQRLLYRKGILFVPDAANALKPENLDLNSPTNGLATYPDWAAAPVKLAWNNQWDATVNNGQLYVYEISSSGPTNVIDQLKESNGTWTTKVLPLPDTMGGFSLSGGPITYVVGDDLDLYSINNFNSVQLIASAAPTPKRHLLSLGFLLMLIPYVISMGLLVLGTWWLMRSGRTSTYLYGKRTVTQASILRRGIARAVDTVLSVFPALFWFVEFVKMEWTPQTQFQIWDTAGAIPFLSSIFGMWLGTILVFSYFEGVRGVTPGKLLCGIRTFRTTLRPCGLLRALTRELMVYADSLFLLTWIPGVLCIAFTRNWQRMGDLAADTVVVMAVPHKTSRYEEIRYGEPEVVGTGRLMRELKGDGA